MENQSVSAQPIRDKTVPYGDDEAILEAFHQDGYCVVTGILQNSENKACLEELWTSKRLLGKFDRNDPDTWASPEWPQQNGGRNFLSSSHFYYDALSWDLASNERLLHVQQLLYGRQDICMASFGRLGVMRPTRDHPEWRTETSWLHWDQNPWTEPNFVRLQAIVCLTDNSATSGGFACVPGFHREFRDWGERHPEGSVTVNGKTMDKTYGVGQPFPVPPDDACQQHIVRVVAPAGSVVVWDSRLPHQNFPNTDAAAFRVVHYSMMHVRNDEFANEMERKLNQKRIIMDLMGDKGKRFPHQLTPTSRLVHCLEEPVSLEESLQQFDIRNREDFQRAVQFVRKAGELEEQGDIPGAIKCHRQSMQCFPEIEEWHDVCFE